MGVDYKKLIIEMLEQLEDENILIKIFTMVEFWYKEQQGRK